MDLSENPVYPGRDCSDQLIGCGKCNFNGNCQNLNDSQVQCECFAWYAGIRCQLNLKILLICMICIGTSVILFLLCILIFYARHTGVHMGTSPIFISASNYQYPSVFASSSLQHHAKLVDDSNSESSHEYEYKLKVCLTRF